MGKKERIRRAKIIRSEALRTLALDPSHDGAYHVLGRWNAEIMRLSGLSRFFAKHFLGARVFDRFRALVKLPPEVRREAIIRRDPHAIDLCWDALNLDSTEWLRGWERRWE